MRAFISYCHKDADLLDQLHAHLSPLQRQGLLDAWSDRLIPPGGVIDQHVEGKLETAELYLLLVTSDFLNSRYCYDKEFARALERHNAGQAVIVPIIMRECAWSIPELAQFKALPTDGRPVISRHWHTPDEGFRSVAEGLQRLLRTETKHTGQDAQGRRKDVFVSDDRHVTEEQKEVLGDLCRQVVDRSIATKAAAPPDILKKVQKRWFRIVWSQFNERFGTQEYGLKSLRRDQFEDARNWFLQYRASKDSRYKRAQPEKYRKTLTTKIYATAGRLGWSKPEVYAFAVKVVGYSGTIESLNALGNNQLEVIAGKIKYEETKRKVKKGQARARGKRGSAPATEITEECRPVIGYVRDSSSTGEMHTYWLKVELTNTSPTKIEGYTLELFFPMDIHVQCSPQDYESDPTLVRKDTGVFRRFTIKAGDTIYRGQTVQIADRIRHPLTYKMDHALFVKALQETWGFFWNLYAGNLPDTSGAAPWTAMHEF